MNQQTFLKIINEKLNIHDYLILNYIDNNDLMNLLEQNEKIKGWIGALIKKGLVYYINNVYSLTKKSKLLLDHFNGLFPVIDINTIILENNISFQDFVTKLHNDIEITILKVTGKKNFRNFSGKLLNTNLKELTERFEGFFKRYGNKIAYKDIEKCVMDYINKTISKENKYAVMLTYYIWNEKNGSKTSELYNDIQNLQEEIIKEKELINTKQLF